MLTPLLLATLAILLFLAMGPRWFLHRSQDRLARETLEEEGARFKLLTRADLVVGAYRRLPGILGLTEDTLSFRGVFGESVLLATSRISRIETGRRLASGRTLLRLEVLRITQSNGGVTELILSPASAFAWRSHLGLWAIGQRQANSDQVVPGKK